MTRDKQIRQASIEYTIKDRPMCIGGGAFSEAVDEMNRNYAFEEGAKWADKTMIEKTISWMKEQVYQEFAGAVFERLITDDMINDFKKTMLEEE